MEMMMMVLLVSAVAQLVSPAPTKQHLNLNQIIDLVAEIQKNVTQQEFFVEDVKVLANNGCKIDFFCKVESILQGHGKEETLVRNLGMYIHSLNVNCTKELEKVPKSEVSKPITDLLHQLDRCSKQKKFYAKSSSSK